VILIGAVLLIVGFLLIVMALIADMMGRIRKTQEEILLIMRDQYFRRLEKENKSEAAED
jgi:hypothetical protein